MIKTGANSLSSILVASDKIYMGFMGSMQSEEMTPQIQVYDFEYKQLHVLNLTGLEENMIYGMALCHNEKWLVVTHQCGFISVVNTEDMTFKSVEPLGYLDNIWGCCIVE